MVAKSVRPFHPGAVTMRNIAPRAQNIPHGLMNAPTVRLSGLQSGYANPANQLAKNNVKLGMTPARSIPVKKFESSSTFKFTRGCVTDCRKLKSSSVDEKLARLL